jgi:formate hydrogenlyase subunit 4
MKITTLAPIAALALFCLIVCAAAVAVGLVESFRPRLRMVHVPEFVLLMVSISLLPF